MRAQPEAGLTVHSYCRFPGLWFARQRHSHCHCDVVQ